MVRATGNLLAQFSVVSFTIISLIAVVLALLLSHKIRTDALESLVNETVGDAKAHLLNAITPADLTVPMDSARYDQFQRFIPPAKPLPIETLLISTIWPLTK